jgi:signal transduction histidine kinase
VVRIKASPKASPRWRGTTEVLIAFSDQGIGIPPDKAGQLFERFYQADGSTTRRFGGMGIGLALCQKIVEAHDGRIWAESAGEGQGSTFYVALPVA